MARNLRLLKEQMTKGGFSSSSRSSFGTSVTLDELEVSFVLTPSASLYVILIDMFSDTSICYLLININGTSYNDSNDIFTVTFFSWASFSLVLLEL